MVNLRVGRQYRTIDGVTRVEVVGYDKRQYLEEGVENSRPFIAIVLETKDYWLKVGKEMRFTHYGKFLSTPGENHRYDLEELPGTLRHDYGILANAFWRPREIY